MRNGDKDVSGMGGKLAYILVLLTSDARRERPPQERGFLQIALREWDVNIQ